MVAGRGLSLGLRAKYSNTWAGWGAVDSYIAIYQCSKNGGKAGSERDLFVFHRNPADCSANGGFLDRSAGFRFCHFQKTTAPVDWA